jgi:hypothetical protein
LVCPADQHWAVEAPGAQERRIEYLSPVRRGEQHDTLARVETVEPNERLVERALLLVVAAAERSDLARSPHRVELVAEDSGRSRLVTPLA